MGKIHLLSDTIVSKIAAGEVIERPLFAVKELIENAIDAHADEISITLEDAGLKKITVTDNGEGMNADDIQSCFLPHTTSKIAEEKDLLSIHSMGFRGEALSSIAAISHLSIKSRPEYEIAGVEVEIIAGKLQKVSPVGMPIGTQVTISNLFFNTPARKKFVTNKKLELRQIIDLVTQYAVSFSEIKFFLSQGKKVILDLRKNQTKEERIKILLGDYFFENILPIQFDETYVNLSGFLTKPQLSARNQQKQFLFLNGRKISDRVISLSVKEAYGNLIESTKYPPFIFYLEVPPQAVDVNVHPRKEHVNFVDKQLIFDLIRKAVSETLSKYNLTFANVNWFDSGKISPRSHATDTFAGETLKKSLSWELKSLSTGIKPDSIQQLHNLYLLVQTNEGLMVVDQHAAHERVLYESLLVEYQKQRSRKGTYKLEKPVVLDFSIQDKQLINDYKRILQKMGFSIEKTTKQQIKITKLPIFFKGEKISDLLLELLQDISGEKKSSLDSGSDKLIKYIACKTAIKRGDPIDKKQAKKLIEELEKTRNNYTCPHGRPTRIEIDIKQINRTFKR